MNIQQDLNLQTKKQISDVIVKEMGEHSTVILDIFQIVH